MGGDPEGGRRMPLLRTPVGGRSVKIEMGHRGWIQIQPHLQPPHWIPRSHPQAIQKRSGLGATSKVGGITPRWPYHPGTNTGTGSQVTCMAALGPKEESQPEAPQAPGDLPPAESSPTREGAWEKVKRKEVDGGHRPSFDTHQLLGFLQGEETI